MPAAPSVACAMALRSQESRVIALIMAGGGWGEQSGHQPGSAALWLWVSSISVHQKRLGKLFKMPISRSHFYFLNLLFIYFHLFGCAKS